MTRSAERPADPPARGRSASGLTPADRLIVAALVAILAVASVATAVSSPVTPVAPPPEPSADASAAPSPVPSNEPTPLPAVYREGIAGRPTSITPLTAMTNADRQLVSLVFSGLVRAGAGGAPEPDLAARWTVDKSGATWTVDLRPDARWQDGTPVTAADVVFTVRALQDPAYQGPDAGSWREVTVSQVATRTVRFKLATPLGGFLEALTQPLLPRHLLSGVPVGKLAANAFGQHPVGSGPFRLVSLSDAEADLEPVATAAADGAGSGDSAGSGAGAGSGDSTGRAEPIERFELHFFADAASLVAAYREGSIDAAVGLPAADALDLAGTPGSRLVRYPRATLTAILPNERAGKPFRDQTLRRALVGIVSREALVDDLLHGLGAESATPVPPTSWVYDASASKPIPFDRNGAAAALKKAGWRRVNGIWRAPGSSAPFRIEVIAVSAASNPIAKATAGQVVASWKSFGFAVTFRTLTPAEMATRLQAGSFSVAILDVNLGLDPDLYPLFASSQATSQGSNVLGIQDQALDGKLAAARAPGSLAVRRKAYRDLQSYLAGAQLMPALFFRDEPVVLANRVVGPAPTLLGGPGDRYWDVLTWRLASGR